MQKLKNILFATAMVVLVAAPAVASAQWDEGRAGGNAETGGNFGLPASEFTNVVTTAIQWLLALIGFLAIIAFVIAGILYLTAAGDESQIEKAKSTMTYAIIGLIVALIGWMVVLAVDALLTTQWGRGL